MKHNVTFPAATFFLTLIGILSLLTACGGGGAINEGGGNEGNDPVIPASGNGGGANAFVEACMSSSNLDQPMCECLAKKAEAELTADGFTYLVAALNQDQATLTALQGKLGLEETTKVAMFMVNKSPECAMELNTP